MRKRHQLQPHSTHCLSQHKLHGQHDVVGTRDCFALWQCTLMARSWTAPSNTQQGGERHCFCCS
jgi:hypothetical protein